MGYWHDGCFAPFCNATFVHKLPDNVSFEAGALTELLACCVHSVTEQAGVDAGDFVAVVEIMKMYYCSLNNILYYACF